MIVAIQKGNYDDDLQTWNENKTVLQTQGCDCCSSKIEPTKENVETAIKEHEEMIARLKELL